MRFNKKWLEGWVVPSSQGSGKLDGFLAATSHFTGHHPRWQLEIRGFLGISVGLAFSTVLTKEMDGIFGDLTQLLATTHPHRWSAVIEWIRTLVTWIQEAFEVLADEILLLEFVASIIVAEWATIMSGDGEDAGPLVPAAVAEVHELPHFDPPAGDVVEFPASLDEPGREFLRVTRNHVALEHGSEPGLGTPMDLGRASPKQADSGATHSHFLL
jgi:hypothetical protein